MPVFKFSKLVNAGEVRLFQKVSLDGVAGPELLGTGDITVSTVGLFGEQIGDLHGTGDIVVSIGLSGQAETVVGTGDIVLSGKVIVSSFAQPKGIGEVTLPAWRFIGVSGDATLNAIGKGSLWIKPSVSGRAGARGSLPCFVVGVSGFGTKEVVRVGSGAVGVKAVKVSGFGVMDKSGAGDIVVPSSIFKVAGHAVVDGRSASTLALADRVMISGFGQDYTYTYASSDDAVLRYEDGRRKI
jgi:hypothetical protein